MINCLVPLAGPDFVSNNSVKGLTNFKGEPLLKIILQSRTWHNSVKQYIFIFYDCIETRTFYSNYICQWFTNARAIFLGAYTQGAALSALSGIACFDDENLPLIVDLADIYYECNIDIMNSFSQNLNLGGIVLTFQSKNPVYSYVLEKESSSEIIYTAEKNIISNSASAGTYFFKNSLVFIDAVSHSLSNRDKLSHNNLLYICPLFNGVIESGKSVVSHPVSEVEDIKVLLA